VQVESSLVFELRDAFAGKQRNCARFGQILSIKGLYPAIKIFLKV
jgi:hypothetical protein